MAGVKLRDVVLRNIQTDFKSKSKQCILMTVANVDPISGKEEILSTDEAQFLNCVSLLCEVMIVS